MHASEIKKFIDDGWVVVDIPQPEPIYHYKELLEKKAREISGKECDLAQIHRHVNDEEFIRLHLALSEFFWQSEFSLNASVVFLPLLKEIIGLDILVQYMPFLRLARPGKSADNIGYHKDTQYGQTPYELAVHVPFVDLDAAAALQVITGSHCVSEENFMHKENAATTIIKGSTEHMLGKPYAPRNLLLPEGTKTDALAMRVGQAALFSPALFHGQEINSGTVTRISTDIRFVNTNTKATLKTGKTRAGYVAISQSPIEESACKYYQAQPAAVMEDAANKA